MNFRSQSEPIQLSIAAVERDTGIGKDTLRVWERRYGFPQPGRDAFGERAYPLEQVEKLRVVKRLLDQGHRPGRIVGLPVEELQRLSMGQASTPHALASLDESAATNLRPYYECVVGRDPDGLRRSFSQAVSSLGLSRFVIEVVAPLNAMVGDGWMRGDLQVFEEHLYTECVTAVLHQALHYLPAPSGKGTPKVLMTTFPQEQHALGLLMAECLMTLQGCRCLSLGTQTPIRDIVMGAQAHAVDVVALSFSVSLNPNHVMDGLAELRQQLPASTEIWAGGRSPILQRREHAGVVVLDSLEAIATQVQRWHQAHPA